MACKCPVCQKTSPSVDNLLEHIMNDDSRHEKWLKTYTDSKNLDFGRMVLQQINGNADAYKPLTALLKKDYCQG